MPREIVAAPSPPPRLLKHLEVIGQLEAIHDGYDRAAREVEQAGCIKTCVPNCGHCCEENTPLAFGIEADYAVSYLLGQPELLKEVVERCRAWLTERGEWTVGTTIDLATWEQRQPELAKATRGRCPFLTDDARCLVHQVRPLVCRAYSVTRMPGPRCLRPRSPQEGEGERLYWDGRHPGMPLYQMVGRMKTDLTEPEWSAQGFFATLIFTRLRAAELAGLWDDGKVPVVKLAVGWGEGHLLLWQSQLGGESPVVGADRAIEQEVPIDWSGRKPLLQLTVRKRPRP